jgi:hypothetical protein
VFTGRRVEVRRVSYGLPDGEAVVFESKRLSGTTAEPLLAGRRMRGSETRRSRS